MVDVPDLSHVDAVTFDCYGTLIDWETGIAAALGAVFGRHGVTAAAEELLEAYARHEARVEAGAYLPYRDVLAAVLRGIAADRGFEPSRAELEAFSASVGDWPAFADSPEALARLGRRFRLGVITNCDDGLFAQSNRRLGVTFDWVVTAEQGRCYKPDPRLFEIALDRIGLPTDRILHVAQSLYHDHVPAKRLGLRTAWVDRRRGRTGFGATPPATASPDLTVPDLATLADVLTS